MPLPEDVQIAALRLKWASFATVVVVGLSLTLELPRSHPLLFGGNLWLIAIAGSLAIAVRRGVITTMTQVNLGGLMIAGLLAAITIAACAIRHELLWVVMLSVQFVAASVLFFSLRWLVVYLGVAMAGAIATLAASGHESDGVLLATTIVLSLTIHIALRDQAHRRDSAYQAQLEDALELARQQLREKERAEAEREAAIDDSARYQSQLFEAQKMEAIGTLAAGLAHDMNNALGGIMGVAECLTHAAPNDDVRADAELILQAAQRAADLTRNLLGFSRRGPYQLARLRAEPLVSSLVTLLARTLPKGITVKTSFADDLVAFEGDAALLGHALVNLSINASDAMSGHGVLELGACVVELGESAARALELQPGRHVVLSATDTGTGMDQATRARIFEPFFTTKAAGQGTGLGLAMVYGAVKRHHGAIVVDSEPGRGTSFRIHLPAAAGADPVPAQKTPSTPIPAHQRSRVLVVDDEPMIRSVLSRILERAGYEVMVAVDGQDGLDVLAREQGRFDLVVLDMAMPRMTGPEMFRALRATYAELRVLLMSGYSAHEDTQQLLAAGALALVEKPFAPALMLETVQRAIRKGSRSAVRPAQG